jgi:hypothetical protein
MSSEINTQLEAFLPCEADFERMTEYSEMTYSEFLKWNTDKISQLDPKYLRWLSALMKMITCDHLTMMDKEDCIIWNADGFFFDTNGKLCLTHSR